MYTYWVSRARPWIGTTVDRLVYEGRGPSLAVCSVMNTIDDECKYRSALVLGRMYAAMALGGDVNALCSGTLDLLKILGATSPHSCGGD